MRHFLIAFFFLTPLAAHAASPEANYFASRDRYIDTFKPRERNVDVSELALKQEEKARSDLERKIRLIVGEHKIQGFPGQGKINLETLFSGDLGFGLLDGLIYTSADDKTHVIVTTRSVFDHWLREHAHWWDGGAKIANVPQQADAALRSEAFYTQALNTDAAVFKYVEFPITKPAGSSMVFAMLAARGQDIGPTTPNELLLALVQRDRIFVISAPANTPMVPIPACQRIWDDAEQKAVRAQDAYIASDPRDQKLFKQGNHYREEGAAAFHHCYAQQAKNQEAFAVLTRQAQVLANTILAK